MQVYESFESDQSTIWEKGFRLEAWGHLIVYLHGQILYRDENGTVDGLSSHLQTQVMHRSGN